MRTVLLATILALGLSACSSDNPKSDSSEPVTTPEATPPEAEKNASSEAAAEVIVNGERLDDGTLEQIEQTYKTKVKPGRYWYDRVSGVWGMEGGPAAGIMAPGLPLGGTLNAGASNGDTGVIVNGRELHQLDLLALRRCVQTVPGRYWVAANGIGGYEGGPAFFDLNALCNAARGGAGGGGGGGGGLQCENYGAGQFNCTQSGIRTGTYGIIGEGNGQAGVFTDQGLVMTPN